MVGNPFPFPGDGVGIVIPPKKGSIAEAHEKARKEAVTDALKRALRHYGAQFANDLYDEDALVDTGDGVLDKVKNVKPGAKQNGKRVVDEHPDKISDQQKDTIQKLCDMLKIEMPEKVNDLAFLEARELIKQLKEKYKEMKASQQATEHPPAQSNGHQPEPEPNQEPATDQQRASIEKLCERLKRPVPQVQSFNQAREVIRQLTAEVRAMLEDKKSEQAQEPEAPPAPAPNGVKLIAENQLVSLLNLYGKLSQQPPEDLQQWSYEQASIGLRELSAQLNAKLKAAKAS